MANLGSLYFDILLRDKTQAERARLKADLQRDLQIKLKVQADTTDLRNQIATALGTTPFKIGIVVDKATASQAVQQALAQVRTWNGKYTADDLRAEKGKTQQAIQQLRLAQAELARVKSEHYMARDAANAHASASINLGGAMGSNIKIAGELGATMAGLYSVHMLKNFLANVIEIGGELEHQKIAMDTIFGDKGKTIVLYDQIKGLARNSPFGVMELTSMVKSLSAYGVEYNQIYDTAKRLADISAATSVDVNRLILAFGKTKSRSFLDGLEAKQFAYANIPIYDMLSKKLTEVEGRFVSVKDIMERISKREISFDMVKDVLWDLTDEGGKFYNMQEQLAGSVKTSWKLVKDNIELMYGDLAEELAGPLKGVAGILQAATREWRTMGTALGVVVALVGVYKTVQALANLVVGKATAAKWQSIMADKAEVAQRLRALSLTQQLTVAEQELIATKGKLTAEDARLMFANQRLNSVDIMRLGTLGKLNKTQLQLAASAGILSDAQVQAITNGRLLGMNMGKFGNIVKATGYLVADFGKSLLALLVNPWTIAFAAIGSIGYLWSKQKQQADKTKEVCDSMFTKAVDGAKSLKDIMSEIPTGISNAAGHEVAQFIEKLKTAIRDYAANPEHIIAEASFNEDGTLKTQQEIVEALRERVELLTQAKELEAQWNSGTMLQNAMSLTDSGWFDDDFLEDLKDYVEQYKDAQKDLTKYMSENPAYAQSVLDFAKSVDYDFAEAAKSCGTWQEQLELLMTQLNRFWEAEGAIDAEMQGKGTGELRIWKYDKSADRYKKVFDEFNFGVGTSLGGARTEVYEELDMLIEGVRQDLARKGVSIIDGEMILPKNMEHQRGAIQEMLRNMATTIFEQAQELPQWEQFNLQSLFLNNLGINLEDAAAATALQKAFVGPFEELPKEIQQKLRQGKWAELDEAMQKKVTDALHGCIPAAEREFPQFAGRFQEMLKSKKFVAEVMLSFDVQKGMSDWQKKMSDVWGGGDNPTITGIIQAQPDALSTLTALAELKKTCQETVNKMGFIKLPFKPVMEAGGLYGEGTIKQLRLNGQTDLANMLEEANKAIEVLNTLNEGSKATGINLSNFDKDKNKNKEDKLAKQWKERLDLLKKAYEEYKKWLALVDKEEALHKVKGSGMFDQLFKGKDMADISNYKGELEALLKKIEPLAKTKERREIVVALKTLLNSEMPRDEIKDAAEKLKTQFDNELSRIGKQWDLYGRLVDAGMKRTDAQEQAFGAPSELKNKGEALMQHIQKIASERGIELPVTLSEEEATQRLGGPDSLLYKQFFTAWKDAKEVIEKDGVDIQVRVLTAANKYKSTAEKIASLSDEYASLTGLSVGDAGELMARDGMSPGQKVMFQEYSEKLAELKGELLALLPEWQQIFGDHTYKSYEQIMRYRDVASQIVDNAKVQKDADGKPTTFTSSFIKEDGTTQEITGTYQNLEKLRKAIDSLYKTAEGKNPFKALGEAIKELRKADSSEGFAEALQKVCAAAVSCKDVLNGVGGSVKEMFEAMGNKDAADATDNVMAALDSAANIGQGFAKGGLIGGIAAAAGEAFKWTAKLLNAQSEAITKSIQESERRVANLEAICDTIERRMGRFLGNARNMPLSQYAEDMARIAKLNADYKTQQLYSDGDELKKLSAARHELAMLYERMRAWDEGGGYGYKRRLMMEELLEKQSQLASARSDKKNNRHDEIQQLEKEIPELQDAIRNMSEDIASELYGIDLKGWASQFGDALFEAWQQGEDGAEAFRKTAGSIMAEVTNSVLRLQILEPMMQDLREALFGKDGQSGMFGRDFEISESEIDEIAKRLMDTQKQTEAYYEMMERVEQVLKDKYNMSMKDIEGKNDGGLSKGIQSVTETTADLLASYINAMRADVSIEREAIRQIAEESLPEFNAIAEAQLRQLETIANNTGRNASAAEAILSVINNNVNPGKGFKIA